MILFIDLSLLTCLQLFRSLIIYLLIKLIDQMDLSQYKMIRSNKFPLPKDLHDKKKQKPHFIQTAALISSHEPESFQIHTDDKSVILFNDHEYLKRQFNTVYQLQQQDNEDLVQQLTGEVKKLCLENYNNLIILNALDIVPIEELIFPWREYIRYNSQFNNQSDEIKKQQPLSILREMIESTLVKKKGNSLVTLSIVGVRSDGSLEDELNYEWIEQSKYIEDLIKIRQKSKLKIKKYKSQIKVFDLNRQQIKEWSEAQQILYHYSQIKQYLQCWKQELEPGINPKIGQIYQICQVCVDQEHGYIKQVFKRKCLLKFNQFMPQSNLCAMKITQLLKQRVQNIPSVCARDFPLDMYLKDCFSKQKNYNYYVLTQLGTNQSLKQQAICLNMDLQIPGLYLYLKNYCDKPQIMSQVKRKAKNFNPLTSLERTQVKVNSAEGNNLNKLKQKTIKILKQSEQIALKSFFYDTYSSNEKKKASSVSQTYNVQTVLQDRKNTFAPYSQFQKPSTTMDRKL